MVMAIVHSQTGDDDAAIDLLEELLETPGSVTTNLLKLDPFFVPLRDNPRFQALLEREDVVF